MLSLAKRGIASIFTYNSILAAAEKATVAICVSLKQSCGSNTVVMGSEGVGAI